MHKPTLPILLAALCLALPASAQIYQWKDQDGKTVISDKPPAGQVPAQKVNTYGPADAPKQPTLAERELEFRKRQKEAQENAEKAQKEEAAAAEKNQNCQTARRQLRALESGERIALRDEKGERYFMDDARRAQETERARRFIETECQQQ
ncbi:MAG: DUF4124 domain-containing protein [Candidatus Accumulibacter sp.]|jgi:hypothetical protein|nr:DUF4124 domain-containing protein [Accumulibacter sp.]